MSQRDAHHEAVRQALVRDGWQITDDPFIIEYEDIQLKADLGAEKTIAAEKGERKIVIEIKVFGGPSFFNEMHKATGQYCNYRVFLEETEPERELYLAVAIDIHQSQFQRPSVRKLIEAQQIKLLIFDPETEEVVQWIE